MSQQKKGESASQRTNDINERLYARNVPSQTLQPYLNARAVSTKYSVLPVIDYRRPTNVPVYQEPVFNTATTFNPGDGFGPWSGFATNINDETVLRNQVYATQNCDAAFYAPSSTSDLYKVHWTNSSQEQKAFQSQNAHPYLFKEAGFSPHEPNTGISAHQSLFHNSTRHQLNE